MSELAKLRQRVAELEKKIENLSPESDDDFMDKVVEADRQQLPSAVAQIKTGHDVQHERQVHEVADVADRLDIDISGGFRGLPIRST